VKTHKRDPEAMRKMAKYCKQDVNLLEKVYELLIPFSAKIPNHNMFSKGKPKSSRVCPSCGSSRLKSNGMRYTQTNSYRRYRCIDCHSWSRTDSKDLMFRSI